MNRRMGRVPNKGADVLEELGAGSVAHGRILVLQECKLSRKRTPKLSS